MTLVQQDFSLVSPREREREREAMLVSATLRYLSCSLLGQRRHVCKNLGSRQSTNTNYNNNNGVECELTLSLTKIN